MARHCRSTTPPRLCSGAVDPAAPSQQPAGHLPPAALNRSTRAGAAAASVIFLTVLVNWSWHLQPARYTSDFYDIQARRVFHGHLSVPLDRIGLEAFRHGDVYHLYFGMFPTLLRMPILLVTDRFDGRLTQPSMLVAWVLLLVALRGLAWHTRILVRGNVSEVAVDRADRVIAFVVPLLAAAATPVLFLASVTAVYHEAILWGLASSLWAFDRLLVVLAAPTRRAVWWFGAAATIAMTSRASVGLAPCAAAGIAAALSLSPNVRWLPRALRRGTTRLGAHLDIGGLDARIAVGLAIAALVPVAAHVAVNEARFGTALSPPYASQVWTELSADRRAALTANDGSLFNARYVTSTVLAYLRPDGAEITRLFPYVWFDPPARVVGDVVFDTRDRTASLTALSPALVALSAFGLVAVARALRRRRALARLTIPVATSTVAVFGVLTIGFIAQRYEGDLLVPGTLLALTGLYAVVDRVAARGVSLRFRRAAVAIAAMSLAWSVWANLSVALLYQRLYVPVHEADRHGFVEVQFTMQRALPGSIVFAQSDSSPTDLAAAGAFHVTGACGALWWSDGTMWIQLEPLPSGASPLCRRLVEQ